MDDFEECKGGSVTFRGSKGYITGKGRIRVGNLDFDSVSFVKELGHFNLFSISQICDKHHKVLFTEIECLVVSPDFKMPDEKNLKTKTPYELLFGHKPIISYIRPFWCHVTILDTLSVLGKFDGKCDEGFLVGYSLNSKPLRWMFDIDYLTNSMNYIPVSLDNQSNPHAGTLEVTNNAGTLQSPNANASEEADEDEELIVVPTAIKHYPAKVGPRKSSTNSKEEKFLTELQNFQTQEKEAFSTGISKDPPEILAFRRDLDQLAQKHLREVTTDKATSTNLVNSGSELANTQPAGQDDLDMLELTIFNKPQKGIFYEASYDE
ncbi:hypothetical protein Tco_0129195 [Tanacetum coccineum]